CGAACARRPDGPRLPGGRTHLVEVGCAGSLGGAKRLRGGSRPRSDGVCRGSAGLLLAGDGALRALAGAGVGLRALTVDGQAPAGAQALVAGDLALAADVRGDLAAQVALDHVVLFDVTAQLHEVFVGDLADPQVAGDAGRGQGLLGAGASHAEDVRQGDFEALL